MGLTNANWPEQDYIWSIEGLSSFECQRIQTAYKAGSRQRPSMVAESLLLFQFISNTLPWLNRYCITLSTLVADDHLV